MLALQILRVLAGLFILATAIPAILGLLGFAVPVFDVFNHLQLALFFATLLALLIGLTVGVDRLGLAVALVGFLASASIVGPEWLSSRAPRPTVSDATTLRVMTHNLFGLNYDMQRVAAVIRAEDPDIVALQEYFPEQSDLDRLLKPAYPYSARCEGGKRANLGLYSKIPFQREMSAAECPEDAYGTQRTAHIIAHFKLTNGAEFSVMTTHMDWPLPPQRQREEFVATEQAIASIKGPLVVVGDFNSTPWSYALKGFEADTALKRETRSLITYPVLFTLPGGLAHTWPFLALDQVFQRGLTITELHRGPETGSDHLPVIFDFAVSP